MPRKTKSVPDQKMEIIQRPLDMGGSLVWTMLNKTSMIREMALDHFKYTYMKELTRSDMKLLSAIMRGGVTVTDIARIRGISRQAVHKGLERLSTLEYLEIVPIPNNAKGLQVEWTEKGKRFRADLTRVMIEIEQEICSKIGTENFQLLQTILAQAW